jgi:ATP-dependent Clp endopeptidase proteolytic subunit ClpP
MSTEIQTLRADLLKEQIRHERTKADLAALELASAEDVERDRLVRGGKLRLLNINDMIIGKKAEAWLDALQHWERRDPGEPITVNINSPGGEVTVGLAIYDTLMRMRRNGHTITTHGQGLVASMASVLLQAGDERVMDERAKLMIHEGSIHTSGESRMSRGDREDMEQFMAMLDKDLVTILAERSTLSERQLRNRWKRKDWWLTAEEALKLGFVDRVE